MRSYLSIAFMRIDSIMTMMKIKNSILILLASFVLSMAAINAQAANYYVDNAATGLNNGTSWANAWQSFANVVWGGSGVKAGDTLYVSGGSTQKIYYEQLTPLADGSSASPITIRVGQDAGHDGTVVINGQQTVNNCIRVWGRSYITITGEKNSSINMKCVDSAQSGILVYDGFNIKIRYIEVDNAGTAAGHNGIQFSGTTRGGNEIAYCSIHDAFQDAIQGGTGSVTAYAYVSIHHNNLYNISDDGVQSGGGIDVYNNTIGGLRVPPRGSGHPDGIQAMGGHVRIYNNVFTETGHANVFVDPINYPGQIVENIFVYNNLFQGGSWNNNAIVIGGDTPNPPNGLNNVYVLNNTIIDVGSIGIDLGPGKIGPSGTLTNARIQNNIVYNTSRINSTGSVIRGSTGTYTTSDLVIDNNTVHQGYSGTSVLGWNGVGYSYANFVAAGYGQANGYNVEPSFISYTRNTVNNDLRLSAADTSSKDLGADLSAFFSTDFYGVLRPKGIAWDIGATEYAPTDSTIPNPPYNLQINK